MSMMSVALWIAHVAVLVVLAYGAWTALHRIRVYTALLAGLAGYQFLALPSLFSLADRFGPLIVMKGELVALFGALIVVGVIECLENAFSGPQYPSVGAVVETVTNRPADYLLVTSLVFFVILVITARKGSLLLEMNWEEARESLGLMDSVATLLLFIALPSGWVAWRSGQRALAVVGFTLSLLLTAVYGSRAAFLTIPALVAFDLHTRRVLTQSRTALLGGVFVMLLVVVALHVTGRFVRGLGLGGLIALSQGQLIASGGFGDLLASMDWTGGESDIYSYYFFVLSEDRIPSIEPLATVFRWFLMYVPRSLVVDFKPIDPTYMLWTHAANSGFFDGEMFFNQILDLVMVGDQGSLHPTFWGEAWMNGGWAALVVMCALLALILYGIDCAFLLLPSGVVILAVPATIVGYLMVARGNSTIGLGYVAYVLPAAWALTWMVGVVKRLIGGPDCHRSGDVTCGN